MLIVHSYSFSYHCPINQNLNQGMTILHASSECYPAAKVGGLGDVAGALPKYLNRVGANASLIMPHYHNKFYREHNWETIFEGDFKLNVSVYDYKIKRKVAMSWALHCM